MELTGQKEESGDACVLGAAGGVEGYRLSPQQRRVWALQREARAGVYRAECAVELEGALDAATLKEAIRGVVARHEILRTAFRRVSGASLPLQVIGEGAPLQFEEYDLGGAGPEERERRAESWLEQACEAGFDPECGPPARVSLLRFAPESHRLLVTLPALCGDRAGLQNFVNEVADAYAARIEGREAEDEPMQYADLSEVLNELLEADDTAKGRDYWRRQNLPAIVNMRLASEKRPAADAPFDPRSCGLRLSAVEAARAADAARALGVAPDMFLLACWYALLLRLGEQREVFVGVAHEGRAYSGLEEAQGIFAKYLPVNCAVEPGESFGEAVRKVSGAVAAASEWQPYFAWEVVAGAAAQAAEPFAPFAFEYEVAPGPRRVAGVTFDVRRQYDCVERFKLKLALVERDGALGVGLHYDPAHFDAEEAARLAQRFRALVSAAAADSRAAVKDLEILGEEERRTLVHELNQTRVQFRNNVCLHELFEEQAAATPDLIAVVYDEEQLTYAELNRRANRLARRLRAAGVGPDVRVAILMERSVEMVVALLGVLKAGGAYVPLDPEYPRDRLAFMLADSAAPVLLTQAQLSDELPTRGMQVIRPDAELSDTSALDDENLSAGGGPQNLAYVIYTSGSTGRPKGAALTHSNISNHMLWMLREFPLSPSDRVLQKTPFSFDASVWEFWAPLLAGARLVLARPGGHRDAGYLIGAAARHGVTTLQVVPALLGALAEAEGLERCGGLRRVFCGGEALTKAAARRVGERLAWAEVVNLYGPTECTIDATWWRCAGGVGVAGEGGEPIGRPVANVRVYVSDERMRLVPYGLSGELLIGGEALARGYLNRPGLTAERFVPDPFGGEPGARLYRTGDLVRYLPGGALEYLGRTDHQVKVRGYRIELGEVEAALRAHAAVKEAVVTASVGAGAEKRLVGYVVPREGETVSAGELREHALGRLPEYMAPHLFVMLGELPLMPNGKVDRRALPSPESVAAESAAAFVAPRNPLEEVMVNIWAEVLGAERLSVNDNFFELGGHSLLATQLISRVRDAFAVELPLRQLFETPTVAGLAASLESRMAGDARPEAPSIVRVTREQPLPLSFAQQRLWFLDQLEPNSALYNICTAVRLTGVLNLAALERTVSEVVRRHEVLRTTFAEVGGQPVQVIHEPAPVGVGLVELTRLAEGERDAEVRRLSAEEAERPFDLGRGPLLRVKLLKLAEEEHVLLFTVHHIITDGWSLGLLIEEVAALYASYARGEESPLAELEVQYADFAAWQQRWLTGEVLEQQLAYWRGQLAGAPAALELPTDRPRSAAQSNRGGHEPFALGAELTGKLKELSRREGATLYMTLLAAFQTLLSRYSGQTDVVVGTPIANRNRRETEELIGFFVNTLVLRGELSGDPSFAEYLSRVREACLGAYMHQDVPFERLVEELQPERDLSRTPLFQAFFVLQNQPSRTLELPGLRLSAVEAGALKVLFDLTLDMREDGASLVGVFEYNTDLFDASTVRRMIGHFRTLLEGAIASPDCKLSDLPLLTEDELRRTLLEWNPAAPAPASDECIHQLFERQAALNPDAAAVIYGDEQLSYGELNARANRLAHRLRAMGVGPEVRVGLCVERSFEMVVALLGVLKAGGAYLPLDPEYPRDRLAFMLADSGARVLVTRSGYADAPVPEGLRVLCLDEDREAVGRESAENLGVAPSPENLAYIIYTSGSTGRPKGVCVTHRAVTSHSAAVVARYRLTPADRVLQFASLSFDVAVEEMFPTWRAGACVVLRADEALDSPASFFDFLEEKGVTALNLPTAYWNELIADWGRRGAGSPRSLRLAAVGGEKGLWEQFARSRAVVGGVELLNVYGPTETTVTNTSFDYAEAEGPGVAAGLWGWSVPIGRPLSNSRLYVLDRRMRPVPVGVPGELYIGGECAARGYLNRPGLTAEKFVPDPFGGEPGARLYRTGDLVRWVAGGAVEFVGRTDHQVKVRGYRIELGEVEAALNAQAGVADSLVMLREGVHGDKRLVAYVVAREGAAPTGSELRRELKERLPEYMVPHLFVALDEWPLTANGKIDRRALPAPEQAGAAASGGEFVAPRTPVEEAVAAIWAEVLGAERVGAEDDFFELGGHSLLATQVVSRVREMFGVEVTLRSLFESPTTAEFAAQVEAALIEKLEGMSDEEAGHLLNEVF